jgi:protein-tyrosine kinase
MSRIDEALRQAGLKRAAVDDPASLESFPSRPEPAFAEPPRDVSEPARAAVPAREPARAPAPALTAPPTEAFSLASEKLVIHEKAGHACVEQYRRVAAMLHQLQEEQGTKVLMIGSTQPSEGKTLTAANLALTLSESYRRRVLLIDADLRRPSLHTLFQIDAPTGLSDRLRGGGQGPLRVFQLSEHLSLLPGGKPDTDPMAGLTSGRLGKIIEQASNDYDWIILDTPPVALQPDARLLAGIAGAVIFVIGAGTTRAALIKHAVETIGREKIVGVVLNRIEEGLLDESAYYGYYDTGRKGRAGGPQLLAL